MQVLAAPGFWDQPEEQQLKGLGKVYPKVLQAPIEIQRQLLAKGKAAFGGSNPARDWQWDDKVRTPALWSAHLDGARLLAEWGSVILVFGGLAWTLRDNRKHRELH
jgi:hypothetical protein